MDPNGTRPASRLKIRFLVNHSVFFSAKWTQTGRKMLREPTPKFPERLPAQEGSNPVPRTTGWCGQTAKPRSLTTLKTLAI